MNPPREGRYKGLKYLDEFVDYQVGRIHMINFVTNTAMQAVSV